MTDLWRVAETEHGVAIAHGRALVDELHFQSPASCREAVSALQRADASLIDFSNWITFDPAASEDPSSSLAWFIAFRGYTAGLTETPGLTQLSATWVPIERARRVRPGFDLALVGLYGIIGAVGISIRRLDRAEAMASLLNRAAISGLEFSRRCFHVGTVTLSDVESFTAHRIEARP